jgi:hypothetical protein
LNIGKEDYPMKSSRYTAEQIAFAKRQVESGTPVPEKQHGYEVVRTYQEQESAW